MKRFNLLNFLKDSRGVSAVESLVAIGLFGAVAFIGLKQSEFMGKSSNELNLKREVVDFQSRLERLINEPSTCKANFVGKRVPTNLNTLVDANGNIMFSTASTGPTNPPEQRGSDQGGSDQGKSNQDPVPHSTYLNGQLKINSMKLDFSDESVFLKIDFEKLNKSAASQFSRSVELMVDLNESNLIESCFSLEATLDETIQYLVAKELCEKTYGAGTPEFHAHFEANEEETEATCAFDGFPSGLNTQCPQGQAITSIQYNSSLNQFSPVCSSPVSPRLCPSGWIRSIDGSGNLQCNDLGNHIDMSPTTVNTPTQCRLMSSSSSSEIKLICAGSGPGPGPGPGPPINGMCRPYPNGDYASQPATNTSNGCSAGAFAEYIDTSSKWRWKCNGENGGVDATCRVDKDSDPTPPGLTDGTICVNEAQAPDTTNLRPSCADCENSPVNIQGMFDCDNERYKACGDGYPASCSAHGSLFCNGSCADL